MMENMKNKNKEILGRMQSKLSIEQKAYLKEGIETNKRIILPTQCFGDSQKITTYFEAIYNF